MRSRSFSLSLVILFTSSESFCAKLFNLVNDLVASLAGSANPGFHSLTIFLIDSAIPPNPSSRSIAATLASCKY